MEKGKRLEGDEAMFADNGKISRRQLAAQLLLSFGGAFLLALPGQEGFAGRQGLLGLAAGYGGFCAYSSFLTRQEGFFQGSADTLAKAWEKAAAFLYALALTATAAYLLQRMGKIGVLYLTEGAEENVLVLLLLGVALLGTGKDIQRRGRLAEALLPLTAAALLLFFALAVFQGDIEYLMEEEKVDWGGVLEKGWLVFSAASLCGVLPFILNRVEGGEKAGGTLRRAMGAAMAFPAACLLLLAAVFGRRGIGYKSFPMADLMAGSSLPGGFLQRLDILWLTALLLCLLFAVGSLLFYAAYLWKSAGLAGGRQVTAATAGALALPAIAGGFLEEYYLFLLTRAGAPALLALSLILGLRGRRKA